MCSQGTSDKKVNIQFAQIVLQNYYPDREVDPEKLTEAANRRLSGEDKAKSQGSAPIHPSRLSDDRNTTSFAVIFRRVSQDQSVDPEHEHS